MWTFGREQSHIDFEFDDPFPGPAWNVALRPDPSDAEMQFSLRTAFFVPPRPPMKFKFVTYVGFAKGKGAVNTADFGVATLLTKALGPGLGLAPPAVNVTHPLGGVPQPMRKIERTFDSSAPLMGTGLYFLRIDVSVKGGEFDANHPPAFFGTRFIPQ